MYKEGFCQQQKIKVPEIFLKWKSLQPSMQYYVARVGNLLFGFSRESLVFESDRAKEQFALLKEQIAFVGVF